jgi:hypothetical protein
VRPIWAIVAGLALGIAVALWLSHEPAQVTRMKQARAEQAAAASARDAVPSLYRWRDASGVLQVTDKPPRGVRYERMGQRPRDGIEVRGDRPPAP